ncbi:hypothetical protein [Bosea sp. 124]|uniref:hypothetical protein n=1 Tax=Bosea sp. 124 TaxID=2135642 RepID=UPI000D3F8B70|nr:hypothetical protein [Bosea sp. 124]PTM41041.1 hypothetical protein C8D03_2574 [Bosea sp. 124]
MKQTIALAVAVTFSACMLLSAPAWAKREASDPRRQCREAIQKANGLGKDAKVSRKDLDRCVANGGRP